MKQKILLLEDDLQLNATVKRFFELNNYTVFEAYDGDKAEEILYEEDIDIMLLDVKVPNQNGFELLKSIRDAKKDTPAVFVTSLNHNDDIERAFGLGCDDYIRKPFALKELLLRVESILKRVYGDRDSLIDISDDISFDSKEMVLTKNKIRVSLKTKESKLLLLMLQNPNQMLGYSRIENSLWGYDEESSRGSLRTYITRLRSLLGKEKIETIKHIGYRYVP